MSPKKKIPITGLADSTLPITTTVKQKPDFALEQLGDASDSRTPPKRAAAMATTFLDQEIDKIIRDNFRNLSLKQRNSFRPACMNELSLR